MLHAILLFVFGGFFFKLGFRSLKIQQQIINLATSKVRSLAMGLVELSGTALISKNIIDPIFSQPCAFFKIVVREERQSGKSTTWVTIHEENSFTVPFYLSDQTGKVAVYPAGVDVKLKPAVNYYTNNFLVSNNEPAVKNYVERFKSFLRPLHLQAFILRENQPIFIVGMAEAIRGMKTEKKSFSFSDMVRMLKSDKARMAALDKNKDGQIDSMEWDQGLKEFQKELEAQLAKENTNPDSSTAESLSTNIIRNGPDNIFILSENQERAISNYKWSGWGMVILGAGLIIAAIWLMLRTSH